MVIVLNVHSQADDSIAQSSSCTPTVSKSRESGLSCCEEKIAIAIVVVAIHSNLGIDSSPSSTTAL